MSDDPDAAMKVPLQRPRAPALLTSVFALFLAFTIGCTPVPKAEFSTYKQSFANARAVSEQMLVDYVAKKEAADALDADLDDDRNEASRLFDPGTVGASGSDVSPIAAHVAAWEVMAQYNAVLTALAAGKSAQEVAGGVSALAENVQSLAMMAGTATPGLGFAVPVISDFLELAEKARTQQEFKEAAQKAHPIIKKIINDVFIPDTKNFDARRELLADESLRFAYGKLQKSGRAAARLDSEHSDPPAGSSFAAGRTKVLQRFVEIFEAFEAIEEYQGQALKTKVGIVVDSSLAATDPNRSKKVTVRQFGSVKKTNPPPTPYTELVLTQLQQLLADGEKSANTVVAMAQEREAYHTALHDYVMLLRALEISLDRLQAKVDQPPNMDAMVQTIFVNTIRLRTSLRKAEAAANASASSR